MVTGNVGYRLAWLMFICLYGVSCKGAERNSANGKDTSVLAESKQSFTIGSDRPFYQAEITSSGKKLSADKKILLVMDGASVAKDPDGVYEVYFTREKSDVKIFSSSHPAFVNVLDVYVLTAEATPNTLTIDLTKKALEWSKNGEPFPSLVVTILFRGNKGPDNTESKQAGQMSIKGIRVVQEK